MTEWISEAQKRFGGCGICGKAIPWSEDVARDIVERDDRMGADPDCAAMRTSINGFVITCDPCIRHLDRERQFGDHAARVFALRHRTYETGLMPYDARDHTFDESVREYEAHNPEDWLWARACTPLAENLWLMGNPGRGKTHMAECIANAHLDARRGASCLTAEALCQAARRFDAEERLKRFREPFLLIMEDIDKAVWDAQGVTAFFALLDARYREKRRLIITTNVNVETWTATAKAAAGDSTALVPAILERMLPMDRRWLKGPSLRREQQTEIRNPAEPETDSDDALF